MITFTGDLENTEQVTYSSSIYYSFLSKQRFLVVVSISNSQKLIKLIEK